MSAKTELISWQVLIDFFNEKIKIAPEKFNSDEFQYPSEVTIVEVILWKGFLNG